MGKTWQGYLQGLAHAVRRIAVEHPAAFPLVATRHPAAPWLRPPLRSLELVDDFLSTLSGFGFTDEQVVGTYRAFSGFLLGNLLLEAAVRGAETSPVHVPLDEGNATVPSWDGKVDLSGSPAVAKFQPLLSQDRSAEEFEISLETLLDRLGLSSPSNGHRPLTRASPQTSSSWQQAGAPAFTVNRRRGRWTHHRGCGRRGQVGRRHGHGGGGHDVDRCGRDAGGSGYDPYGVGTETAVGRFRAGVLGRRPAVPTDAAELERRAKRA